MTRPLLAAPKPGPSLVAALALVLGSGFAPAQDAVPRILVQDPALNNLVDPPGVATAPLGALGGVVRAGTGPQPMILVPGLGFGGQVFDEFMARLGDRYSMYAVTLSGFGGTAAPPCPPAGTSFGEQTWTNAAVDAISRLIDDEGLERPVVVGHWIGGTQVAIRLALRRPDDVRAVVLLAGAARMHSSDPARAAQLATPELRLAMTDQSMAPLWFKTVTRATWDDNNFLPGDYAVNPVRGLRLWREAATPRLHVWVRYLCEFNAQDITHEIGKLAVPVLRLEPGLEGTHYDPGNNYMADYCHASWAGTEAHPQITGKLIPNSRACLWFDQPDAVAQAVTEFVGRAR